MLDQKNNNRDFEAEAALKVEVVPESFVGIYSTPEIKEISDTLGQLIRDEAVTNEELRLVREAIATERKKYTDSKYRVIRKDVRRQYKQLKSELTQESLKELAKLREERIQIDNRIYEIYDNHRKKLYELGTELHTANQNRSTAKNNYHNYIRELVDLEKRTELKLSDVISRKIRSFQSLKREKKLQDFKARARERDPFVFYGEGNEQTQPGGPECSEDTNLNRY